MKKIILVFSSFLLMAFLFFILASNNELFAVSGCCKQRSSYGASWSPNHGMNIKDCEKLNQELDGDNVFLQQGLVWWDTRCL